MEKGRRRRTEMKVKDYKKKQKKSHGGGGKIQTAFCRWFTDLSLYDETGMLLYWIMETKILLKKAKRRSPHWEVKW